MLSLPRFCSHSPRRSAIILKFVFYFSELMLSKHYNQHHHYPFEEPLQHQSEQSLRSGISESWANTFCSTSPSLIDLWHRRKKNITQGNPVIIRRRSWNTSVPCDVTIGISFIPWKDSHHFLQSLSLLKPAPSPFHPLPISTDLWWPGRGISSHPPHSSFPRWRPPPSTACSGSSTRTRYRSPEKREIID